MGLSNEEIQRLLKAPEQKSKPAKPKSGLRTVEGPFEYPNMLFITRFIKTEGCQGIKDDMPCKEQTAVRILGRPYCLEHMIPVINLRLSQMRFPLKLVRLDQESRDDLESAH